MLKNRTLILDFDSTLVQVESLDLLSEIVFKRDINKEEKISEIKTLTEQGMNGSIAFQDSLQKRIKNIRATRDQIQLLGRKLVHLITPSFLENCEWLIKNSKKIHIFSGGFKETIIPVGKIFNIPEKQIHANEFIYSSDGIVTGVNEFNPFSRSGGKVEKAKEIGLHDNIIMVGDGNTDAEMKDLGNNVIFIAFVENVTRESVLKKADRVANSFDNVINFINQTI